jgi:hypothetical protein
MSRLSKLTFVVLLIGVLAPLFIQPTQARPSGSRITVIILDAYYHDYDNDLNEDDITMELIVFLEFSSYLTKEFSIYTCCEKPSGETLWVEFRFIGTGGGYFFFDVTYLNYATESGWYDAITYSYVDGDTHWDYCLLTFDPPGEGNDGGEPIITYSLW